MKKPAKLRQQLISVLTACALLLSGVGVAHAGLGAGSGADGDSNSSGSKPPTGNGNGGGPPGGSTEETPAPPADTKIVTTTIDYRDGNMSSWVAGEATAVCSAKKFIGATVKYSYRVATDGDAIIAGSYRRISVTCHALNVKTETLTCVVSSTAAAVMVLPEKKTVATSSQRTAWAKSKTIKACRGSKSSASVKVDPAGEFGRYVAAAHSLVQSLTIRVTTDPLKKTKKEEIVSIGAERRVNPSQDRGELLCSGWKQGWSAKVPSFTADDCETAREPITCAPLGNDKPVLIAGETRTTSTIFRHGEGVALKWQRHGVRGKTWTAKGAPTFRVTRNADGTPWADINGKKTPAAALFRIGWSKNDASQRMTSTTSTAWVANRNTAWARGMWASKADLPTILTPQWKYEGVVTVRSVRLSVGADGSFKTVPVTTKIPTTKVCSGAPGTLTFVRGVSAS